ncbi:hypothetical protein HDU97_005117, partial [Phlyctochytrium planicorne]
MQTGGLFSDQGYNDMIYTEDKHSGAEAAKKGVRGMVPVQQKVLLHGSKSRLTTEILHFQMDYDDFEPASFLDLNGQPMEDTMNAANLNETQRMRVFELASQHARNQQASLHQAIQSLQNQLAQQLSAGNQVQSIIQGLANLFQSQQAQTPPMQSLADKSAVDRFNKKKLRPFDGTRSISVVDNFINQVDAYCEEGR